MEFHDETPSRRQNSIKSNRMMTSSIDCDSPFRFLPNTSTPPSRLTRILNPFESHLIERLHLPTFSPSVFAQVSTPKTDKKFKWSIDQISSLKPADIDEETISQHVADDHDPNIESMAQEKIDKFFNDKVIVPSPLTEEVKRMPLLNPSSTPSPTQKISYSNGSAQTVLTLPPVLPSHIEEMLKPFFTYTEDQQKTDHDSLYRKLFEFGDHEHSIAPSTESSPALSTGLSPIQLSPIQPMSKRTSQGPIDLPELRDCTISPIGRSYRESRSACRLSFSGHMSVDASVRVPDVNQVPDRSHSFVVSEQNSLPSMNEFLGASTVNWDMEFNNVSLISQSPVDSPPMIDSNTTTPHSKIFTSQRKRLSDSFKDEDRDMIVNMDEDDSNRKRSKSRFILEDITDGGYQTGGATDSSTWNSSHMFASTPTKYKN